MLAAFQYLDGRGNPGYFRRGAAEVSHDDTQLWLADFNTARQLMAGGSLTMTGPLVDLPTWLKITTTGLLGIPFYATYVYLFLDKSMSRCI